jgi:hypothetical protein
MKRRSLGMLALGVLLSLSMITSSCAAVDHILGPQAAAQQAFRAWVQRTGSPYRDMSYQTLTDDGTYAFVRIVGHLRLSATVDWMEYEATTQCHKVGGLWQCDEFLWFAPTDAERRQEQLRAAETMARDVIEGRTPYEWLQRIEQTRGERGQQTMRDVLDQAARLIARGEYQLAQVADPQLTAYLIAHYSDEYGFGLDDLEDAPVREQVEQLLEAGEY